MMTSDIKKLRIFSALLILLVLFLFVSCKRYEPDSLTKYSDESGSEDTSAREETTSDGKLSVITKPKETSKPDVTDPAEETTDDATSTEIPSYIPGPGIGAEVDWEEGTA